MMLVILINVIIFKIIIIIINSSTPGDLKTMVSYAGITQKLLSIHFS